MALLLFFLTQVALLAWFWIRLAGWYAAGAIALLLGTTGIAAYTGLLAFGSVPPRMLLVMATGALLTVLLSFSSWGDALANRAGLQALIGFQGFRILVELFLWWGHSEGIVPLQMTFEGRNFDILSGLAAIPVALWWSTSKPAIWAWNLLGLGLLLNIVTVAVLSMPTPLQQFSPPNTFVTEWPYVWLPAFLVTSALLGHLLVTRWLLGKVQSVTLDEE